MGLVEEGAFLAGEESRPVWLAAYYMDVFPTTNADYAKFVATTGHASPRHWNGNTHPRGCLITPWSM